MNNKRTVISRVKILDKSEASDLAKDPEQLLKIMAFQERRLENALLLKAELSYANKALCLTLADTLKDLVIANVKNSRLRTKLFEEIGQIFSLGEHIDERPEFINLAPIDNLRNKLAGFESEKEL
jgi:hypothetical protein